MRGMSWVRPLGAWVVLWLAGCSVNTPPDIKEAPPVLAPPIQFTSWQRVAPSQDVEFPLTPETTAEQIRKVRAYDCHHPQRTLWLPAFVKTRAEGKSLVVRMPTWAVMQGIWKPHFFGMDAVLDVCMAVEFTSASSGAQEITWPLELKDLRWAWCFAALAVLGTLLISGIVARAMRRKDERNGLPVLDLVLGPTGTYSLSRTQLLIWTLVTIFGLAFVWNMTERFLEITPQMLMFLGIASGTTVATRLAASGRVSALPPRIRELVGERRPRLADLIGVENRPSVVKLQMLIFTLITAIIVIKEIVTKFAFPELSEGLVTLMGISSATYVSSELASRVDVDRVTEYAKRAEEAIAKAGAASTPAQLRELPEVKELVYLLDTQLP